MKKTWKEKTKKEKIRTVLTICQRICAGIAAGIIILCFAFVGFKRCSGNKSMVKLAYAEEASATALNDSTTNFFTNLWQEKTASFTPYCKPGWAILNGLPDLISGKAQILPYNKLTQTMDGGTYYIINETIENPLSLENSAYNLLCISSNTTLMDSSTNFALIAVIDTLENNTQITTWIALSLQARTSNGKNYPYYANAYRWTQSGTITDIEFQAVYSGGYGGVQANQSNKNNSFSVGTSIEQNTLSYIKLPTQANLKTRQIKAKYRLDYTIRFFDYSLYGGDTITNQIATLIEENTTNNFYGISSIYNGTGGGGTSGVTQEEYNRLNQQYQNVLTELNTAQLKIANLNNEISNLQTELNTAIMERDIYLSQREYFKGERDKLEINIADLETNINNLQTQITNKNTQINNLEAQIEQLEANLNQEGNRWKQGYETGYNKGVSDTKTMNMALTIMPQWAVTIWNGALGKEGLLMFDIYGFKIGELLIGLTTLFIVISIAVKVLS